MRAFDSIAAISSSESSSAGRGGKPNFAPQPPQYTSSGAPGFPQLQVFPAMSRVPSFRQKESPAFGTRSQVGHTRFPIPAGFACGGGAIFRFQGCELHIHLHSRSVQASWCPLTHSDEYPGMTPFPYAFYLFLFGRSGNLFYRGTRCLRIADDRGCSVSFF
jgi:hypothetical protein